MWTSFWNRLEFFQSWLTRIFLMASLYLYTFLMPHVTRARNRDMKSLSLNLSICCFDICPSNQYRKEVSKWLSWQLCVQFNRLVWLKLVEVKSKLVTGGKPWAGEHWVCKLRGGLDRVGDWSPVSSKATNHNSPQSHYLPATITTIQMLSPRLFILSFSVIWRTLFQSNYCSIFGTISGFNLRY